MKNNLKALGIDDNNWETLVANRAHWRQAVKAGFDLFKQKRVDHARLKMTLRKQDVNIVPTELQVGLKCEICSCLFLSKAGLISHHKAHA